MKTLSRFAFVSCLALLSMSFVSGDWQIFKTASFSIEFPGKPQTEKQSIPSEVGELETSIHMLDQTNVEGAQNIVYMVLTTEYPEEISSDNKEMLPDFFKNAISGALENVEGKLLSEKDISISGYPGKEIKVDYMEGIMYIYMRCYLVKNRMFVVQTMTMAEHDQNADMKRFFNSFQALGK